MYANGLGRPIFLAAFGSDALKERWLPEMAGGRPVGMFALSEPGAGSNPAEMETTARKEGDEYGSLHDNKAGLLRI